MRAHQTAKNATFQAPRANVSGFALPKPFSCKLNANVSKASRSIEVKAVSTDSPAPAGELCEI